MNDWPEGWTDDRDGTGRAGAPRPESPRVMRHVQRPVPRQQPRYGGPGDDGWNEGQVYRAAPAGPPPPPGPREDDGHGYDGYRERRRPDWRRRITWTALTLVVVLLVTVAGTYLWADSKLRKEVDLEATGLAPEGERPPATDGTTYLIVGTDSREGLSAEERSELHTGDTGGKRTDTMMILHRGGSGSTLVSLPRDSWVTIPSFTGSVSGNRIPEQQNKLNAAYAIEGPELLIATVEQNTGLRIDHYAEIGFGGFAGVVDALGGVEMCFEEPIKDKNSGADFEAGCQKLDGADSLAFVRQRYQEAMGDLGRTKNQQKFLGALGDQVASPGTLLNPFRLYPTMGASLDSLIVDKDMSAWELSQMFLALRGVQGKNGTQMNVPVANPGFATDKGSAVLWDEEKSQQLFDQIRNDEKITVTDE